MSLNMYAESMFHSRLVQRNTISHWINTHTFSGGINHSIHIPLLVKALATEHPSIHVVYSDVQPFYTAGDISGIACLVPYCRIYLGQSPYLPPAYDSEGDLLDYPEDYYKDYPEELCPEEMEVSEEIYTALVLPLGDESSWEDYDSTTIIDTLHPWNPPIYHLTKSVIENKTLTDLIPGHYYLQKQTPRRPYVKNIASLVEEIKPLVTTSDLQDRRFSLFNTFLAGVGK